MATISFPSSPVNGEFFPVNPLIGQTQYQWSSSDQTWRIVGTGTGVVGGTYGDATNVGQFTVNAAGQVTFAQNIPITGAAGGTVTSVDVSGGTTGLSASGGPITVAGTITLGGTLALTNGGTGATTQSGAQANLLPAQTGNAGKVLSTDGAGVISWVTACSGTVTSVTTGTGLTGGTITSSGTIALADTAVAPASYTYSSITVDQQGRLTSASSGTSPVTSVGIIGTSGIGVVSGSPVTTSGSITLAIDIATLPVLP